MTSCIECGYEKSNGHSLACSKKLTLTLKEKDAKLELESVGFDVQIFNYYQFRIRTPDFPVFWDWYHTTGSLVENKNGYCGRDGTFETVEALIEHLVYKLKNYE